MAVRFTPSGNLDVSTDPQELPEVKDVKSVLSGAMTRCTNLMLDRSGIASTRPGTSKVNSSALPGKIDTIAETSGYRYSFSAGGIYKDESELESGLTDALWSALVYKAYNATEDSVFAVNGTDRRRLTGNTSNEWGIDAPAAAPTLYKSWHWCYLHDWEAESGAYLIIEDLTAENTEAYTAEWESEYVTDTNAYFAFTLQCPSYYSIALALWEWEDGTRLESVDAQLSDYLRKFTASHDAGYEIMYNWEGDTLDGDTSIFAHPHAEWMYWFEQRLKDETSSYQVRYTYCRKNEDVLECESNPSPAGSTNFDSGGVVVFPAPSDSQITHVRLYRTLANGGEWYYDSEAEVALGYGILSKSDTELGAKVETDHDRPPAGTVVAGPNFDGSCFIIRENNLYYCKAKQPEYWPADYYIEVSRPDDPLQAIAYVGTAAFVASKTQIYQIQGTGVSSFFPLPMGCQCGTLSPKCFCPVQGQGIYHLGYDGIYQFRVGSDVKISDAEFQPMFAGETAGSIPGLNRTCIENCWMILFAGKVWFGFPGGTDEYPADALVTDVASRKTVHMSWPFNISSVVHDTTNNRLLAGCTDGYVRVLHDSGATDDDGAAVSWEIESKAFGGLRKYFPRFARHDVSLGTGAVCNGYIILDGEVKQTHAVTESRQTRKRLIAGCTGDRLSLRLSGTGPVDIYGMEAE